MKKLLVMILCLVFFVNGCKDNTIKVAMFSSYVKGYVNKNDSKHVEVEPFGSYVGINGYDAKVLDSLNDEFNSLVKKYHSLLDRNYYYKDDEGNIINNIKVINDSYNSGNSIKVDRIIIDVLKAGIKYTKLSNGKFNIFAGSVVDLWDERFNGYSSKYKIDPSEEEVSKALMCVVKVSDIDNVLIIDEVNNSVTFNGFSSCESGASITLGALAKSYFLDKLMLEDTFKNINSVLYDAGQSSIVVRGENPIRENKEWLIDISDCFNKGGGIAFQIKLNKDSAVSTSSGEIKGYVNDCGDRRHHIIDALSGYPNNSFLSVTVVGESSMLVDIVTTTLMTMNLNEAKIYLKELKQNNINIKVSIQAEEDDKLKVLVDEDMKKIVSKVNKNIILEEFSYEA